MSSDQEEKDEQNSQHSQNQQQEEEKDEDDDKDEDEEQDDSKDDSDDQNEEEDEQGDEQKEDEGDQDQQEEESKNEESEQNKQSKTEEKEQENLVPTFKAVPEQFTFKNLIAEIASLENSVDHFINTLPSRGGTAYRWNQPKVESLPLKSTLTEALPVQQKKYTIMKDQDIQVSMQPQIVIQQTLPPKESPKKQPYRISNESSKFLAQLYEENKKLKKWQNSQTGGSTNNWLKSKQRFSRPEYERGLINLDDRNKEIDEAIEELKRSENQEYL